MIQAQLVKYILYVVIIVGLLSGVYYKGYSDSSNKHEKEALVVQIEVANRVSKVEDISKGIADLIAATSGSTTEKLDTIIKKSNGKSLTSVPCTPSPDFVTSWNELNKVTK